MELLALIEKVMGQVGGDVHTAIEIVSKETGESPEYLLAVYDGEL